MCMKMSSDEGNFRKNDEIILRKGDELLRVINDSSQTIIFHVLPGKRIFVNPQCTSNLKNVFAVYTDTNLSVDVSGDITQAYIDFMKFTKTYEGSQTYT